MTVDPTWPKLTLFEFEKTALVWLKLADAVMSELPLIPNETLLLFDQTTVPDVAVWVPPATLTAGCFVCAGNDALAVTVEPAVPNVTLFAFE